MSRDFQQTQRAFAAQIRNPKATFQDIEPRRMKIYEDLFFKNIESFVANAFPVFRTLFSDTDWLSLMREFMVLHRAKTPYFLEISQEFMAFTQAYTGAQVLPPFTSELLHYEWVELALDVAEEDIDWSEINPNGDVLASPVVVSPVAWPLCYQYPVQNISAAYQPTQPGEQPVYLLVFRDRSLAVRFTEINLPVYQLLSLLQDNPDKTGQENLGVLGQRIGFTETDALLNFGRELLENLQRDGIVLGVKRSR